MKGWYTWSSGANGCSVWIMKKHCKLDAHLAIKHKVAASTQNQTLSAIIFLIQTALWNSRWLSH